MNIFVQVSDFKILTIDFVQSLKICLMRKRQRMYIATRQKGEISACTFIRQGTVYKLTMVINVLP